MNEKKSKPKKLYKITTHNTMIEEYEVEADSLDSARSYVFDCWTAEDRYCLNVERTAQYFDSKSVEYAELFAVECGIEDDDIISTKSSGFWKEATIQQIEEDTKEYES
mgnify:FL=1|jgi:hypothetical protein